jgi:hypothetical protein
MGGKTSTTTQQVQIPPEVLARYNAVNTKAETVAQKPFQIYSTDPADFVAQLNQQQMTGIENVNTAAGSYQPYLAGATGATMAGMSSANPADLEISKYMNPFQEDVINATMARMRQEQEQAQSGALGTAISSGAFGGDRAGIAAANLAQQQGMATGATLAGLNAQNYSQALQTAQQQQGVGLGAEQANLARLLSGGQQLAGLGQAAQGMGLQGAEAQINAGTLGQQTEQAGLSALYNQFQQQHAYPFQVAQFLANIAMGTGALSGSTTQTTQPTPFFSDRRLKHDIKRIGKTDEGLPIYKFKYKGDDSEQTHVGFMADEVEKHRPEAVGLDPSGYKTVDYDRATKAGGGGVAGPYGAMVGSQPGVGGYVPQAYLPVGELMVADSAGLDNAQKTFAQQMEAAANFGENMIELKDRFGKGGDFWELFRKNENSRGGVVGYASGGPAYLEGGLKPAENPVQKEGYLSDTVKSQEDTKKNQIMQPGSAPGQQASGASQLGTLLGGAGAAMSGFAAIAPLLSDRRAKHSIRRIGKTDDGMPIYKFKYKGDEREQTHIGFMADEVERKHPDAVMTDPSGMKKVDYGQADKFYQGGVVRQGYRVGGGPEAEEEIIRRRLMSGDVPKPMNLGDLPNARVLPAVEAMPNPRLSGLARAAIERAEEAPAVASGLAPATSMRPQARPEPTALAVANMSERNTPMADTGNTPSGGYTPIVPLKTQLDFVMHELAMPEYNSFLRAEYETPEQAAIGFEKIYERANGAGNERAAAYARDVYSAVSNGDMSGLPPNAVAAFEHFTENGMDPIKAAGATGRLMVESYANMDPNARNTLGGGYGTYGVAQWRGPRMEALADFAGVPMDAITSAPVSTPDGRYYSTGDEYSNIVNMSSKGVAGGAGSQSGSEEYSGGLGLTPDKPYEDRTAVGKMFYNPDGTTNKDALLSILSGIGTMASSPSLYLGSAILQGIGGAANTYAGLEKQRGDIVNRNLENMRQVAMDTMQWNELNGTDYTPAQYARMNGLNVAFPETATAQDILSGAYNPTTGEDGLRKLSYQEFQNGSVDIGGRTVPMQNDPASLNRFIQDNGMFAPDTPIGRQVEIARARLAQIDASGGMTTDANDQQFQIPGYTAVGDTQAQAEANRLATAQFREAGVSRVPQIGQQLEETDKQTLIFTQLEAGSLTNEMASAAAVMDALGIPVPEGSVANAALAQQAIKLAASRTLGDLSNLPGGAPAAELDRLAAIAADTNLQPEAVKMILTMQKASLLRERARYALRNQWASENPGLAMDQYAYEQWFDQNEPYSKYYDEVKESMPIFAGELGSKQEPYTGITQDNYETVPVGAYYIGTDGRTYGPKQAGE